MPFRMLAARCLRGAPALLPLILLLSLAAAPGAARAGTYQVRTCDAAAVNRAFAPWGASPLVAADGSCFADPALGMRVRNSVRGPADPGPAVAPAFTTAGLEAVAPDGTRIVGLHADATAYDDVGAGATGGWRAGVMVDGARYVWCGVAWPCSWAGAPGLRVDLGMDAASVQLAVICGLGTGCLRDRVRAATTLHNVILDVRDDVPATIDGVRGDAVGAGWIDGLRTVGFDAADAAGVRRTSLDEAGTAIEAHDLPCDPYAMAPCPAAAAQDTTLDTRRMPDGPHVLALRAVDAGGSVASTTAVLYVDNTAPIAGVPEVVGGSAWRASPDVQLTVAAQDGAGGSGVRALRWELCRETGADCVEGSQAGSPATLALRVPAPGVWRVRVRAADALRDGPRSGWSDVIRFDDTVPGAARVRLPAGWVDGRAPVVARIDLAVGEAVGPSGIAGWVVTTDGTAPGDSITVAGPEAAVDLADLPEGTTTVRARAVSGAGVAAATVGDAAVRVDRTAPEVVLNVPGGSAGGGEAWLGRAVTLRAQASDQPGLSGMDGAPADLPAQAGGHVDVRVDDGPVTVTRGADVPVEVQDDGIHVVTARAVDAAGNVSAPASVTLRLDLHDPQGRLLRPTIAAPRRLRARVDEGCIADAALELRPAGTAAWRGVDATSARGEVAAVVPDDRLAAGRWDVRFRVHDCAGNEGVIDRWDGEGGRASLELPLRGALSLSARLVVPTSGATRAVVAPGRVLTLAGRLRNGAGVPVAGRVVRLEERVGAGEWRTVRRAVTDADGQVRCTIGPGPSRRLRLVADGADDTLGAVSPVVRIAVPARATISVDRRTVRNGQVVRFRGRVLGGHLPPQGRELELQGFNPLRGRWQPVRTQGLRCDGHGFWHASYRFTATVGATVTYRFRLRVAPRPDHPFAEGRSGIVAVTVIG